MRSGVLDHTGLHASHACIHTSKDMHIHEHVCTFGLVSMDALVC